MDREQALSRDILKREHPKEFWETIVPKKKGGYNGKWEPEELAEYYSSVNRGRFPVHEAVQTYLDSVEQFLEEWSQDL